MRLPRSFRDTDLNCVCHELSVFHRHGVDNDSVPDMQVAWRCRCAFLPNFVSEEIITSTVVFVLVSTVADFSDTLITVPITCCSFP